MPVDEGGTLYVEGDDVWIEEYPLENPPKHVLNGFIFAILGLFDAYLAAKQDRFLNIFLKSYNTLKNTIRLYDLGYWSLYDVDARNIALPKYHLLNTVLVYTVSILMNDKELREISKRWALGHHVASARVLSSLLRLLLSSRICRKFPYSFLLRTLFRRAVNEDNLHRWNKA